VISNQQAYGDVKIAVDRWNEVFKSGELVQAINIREGVFNSLKAILQSMLG